MLTSVHKLKSKFLLPSKVIEDKLLDIDFSNMKNDSDLFIGFTCKMKIRQEFREGNITGKEVKVFYQPVRNF